MFIARCKQPILYARNRSTHIGEVTMNNRPSEHQAAVGLPTAASHQSRTNPSDPAIRHPFQTAGPVSYHQVRGVPYRLRVSSRMSPTGHLHGDQMLSHLRRAGAFQKGGACTSRLVRCAQRVGQGKAWPSMERNPKGSVGFRVGSRDRERFWRSQGTFRKNKIGTGDPRSTIPIPRTTSPPELRFVF